MAINKLAAGIGIFIIAIIVALVAMSGSRTATQPGINGTAAQSHGSLVALQLTDPPLVPAGTQSLVINYSSVQVHSSGASGSGWIDSNASGSIDLLSIVNFSQTIGTVRIPNGTVVDMVRFNVSSASITVNGTEYNVTVPSSQITAHIASGANLSGGSSVLMSLSPTVVALLTSNSTVFVMVPSLRAVVLPGGTNQSTVRVGTKVRVEGEASDRLQEIRPNISITGAALTVSGNITSLSVTVQNNGNQSVAIKHASMMGNISTALNAQAIENSTSRIEAELRYRLDNISACANVTSNATANVSQEARIEDGQAQEGVTAGINATVVARHGSDASGNSGAANASVNATVQQGAGESGQGREAGINNSDLGDLGDRLQSQYGLHVNNSVCTVPGMQQFQSEVRSRIMNLSGRIGAEHASFRQMPFLVYANGTLSLPYNVEDFNDTGYQLLAGQSHTFTFTGVIATNDGGLLMTPEIGSTYQITVGGEHGASVSGNVTASSG